mgnify:CR=1 FL=1
MTRLFLSGATGAMGRTITEFVADLDDIVITGGYACPAEQYYDYPVYDDLSAVDPSTFDMIVDFSHFSVLGDIIAFARRSEKPIVVATTGIDAEGEAMIQEASAVVPVFRTANMSFGVNLMVRLLKQAAKASAGYDIEIIEAHHNKKVDSPSGTAVMLANAIVENRPSETALLYGRHGKDTRRKAEEITIHAVRGGTIPGDHTVLFAGADEVIEIKHSALSKKVFADGAVKAVRFLAGKPVGLYNMDDVINQ